MGEVFSAERAREAGFVNHIVPSEQLEATALKAAHSLAGKPREAVLLSRRLLRGGTEEIKARMKEEVELFAERIKSEEAMGAFQAFLQRPKPALVATE
jgi:enoyl-CoA hydratase/carnithine racemase